MTTKIKVNFLNTFSSGQQILGPPKRNPEKIIKDLFQKAKELVILIKSLFKL
jgi:hypothetical protein